MLAAGPAHQRHDRHDGGRRHNGGKYHAELMRPPADCEGT